MKLVDASDAMELCAEAMDRLTPEDAAREDVRAIYLVAGQIRAAWASTPHVQVDPRIAIPDWLAGDQTEGSE